MSPSPADCSLGTTRGWPRRQRPMISDSPSLGVMHAAFPALAPRWPCALRRNRARARNAQKAAHGGRIARSKKPWSRARGLMYRFVGSVGDATDDRKLQPEHRRAVSALVLDRSSVVRRHPLHDRQAEAGAAFLRREEGLDIDASAALTPAPWSSTSIATMLPVATTRTTATRSVVAAAASIAFAINWLIAVSTRDGSISAIASGLFSSVTITPAARPRGVLRSIARAATARTSVRSRWIGCGRVNTRKSSRIPETRRIWR